MVYKILILVCRKDVSNSDIDSKIREVTSTIDEKLPITVGSFYNINH